MGSCSLSISLKASLFEEHSGNRPLYLRTVMNEDTFYQYWMGMARSITKMYLNFEDPNPKLRGLSEEFPAMLKSDSVRRRCGREA